MMTASEMTEFNLQDVFNGFENYPKEDVELAMAIRDVLIMHVGDPKFWITLKPVAEKIVKELKTSWKEYCNAKENCG